MTVKTREEINELKRQWEADPQWDLETTEGFEAHHDELLIFSLKCENEWLKDQLKYYQMLKDALRAAIN